MMDGLRMPTSMPVSFGILRRELKQWQSLLNYENAQGRAL